jgi:hypothetical protein
MTDRTTDANDRSINIKITPELLEALVFRRLGIVYGDRADLKSAPGLAEELFRILEGFQNLRSVEPPKRPPIGVTAEDAAGIERIELPDMQLAILKTILGWESKDVDANANEGLWLQGQFSMVDGNEIYERFLKLYDAVNDTDISTSGDDWDRDQARRSP